MSFTFDLYTRWKNAKGYASDRQALTALGVSHGAAVHWKAGRNADANVIEQMAKDLGENPMVMVALAMKEQSRGDAAKTWARFAKQLGAAAALAVALLPLAVTARAETLTEVGTRHYAKLRRVARRLHEALSRLTDRACEPSAVLA